MAGHIILVTWYADYLHYPLTSVCAHAARGGHIRLIQWARARGAPWDKHTFNNAAANGKTALLQWLCEQNAPWEASTSAAAAGGGYLKVALTGRL